jgi:hypothetical protein
MNDLKDIQVKQSALKSMNIRDCGKIIESLKTKKEIGDLVADVKSLSLLLSNFSAYLISTLHSVERDQEMA